MPKLRIPKFENIRATSPDQDPLRFYYQFGKGLYFKRLKMVAGNITGPYEKLLDIGYGSGIFLPELASRADQLYAVDMHQSFATVKAMMQKEGIEAKILSGNILRLPFKNDSFDAVSSVSLLEHIHDVHQAAQEVRRVLKPGGVFSAGFPTNNPLLYYYLTKVCPTIDEHHVSDQNKILSALRTHFKIVKKRTFPALFPLNLSIYCSILCVKQNGNIV